MAQIPIPSIGAGTQLRALPGGRLETQDQTAGLRSLGESLERAGQFGFSYADEQDKMDQTLDRTAVRQADTEAAKRIRERLWLADNALYKQKGWGAANAKPLVEKEFGELREELRGKLTTDRQRAWFDQAYDARVGQENEGISRYVTAQMDVEERRQSLASITEASNDAITYWDDPERRQTEIAKAITETRAQGAKDGWLPEVVNRAATEAESAIYTRAIGGMIDRGDIEGAHAELIRSRDKIDPDSETKLDAALRNPLLEREAEGIVDSLMGTLASVEVVTEAAVSKGEVLPRMTDITAHAESRNRERDAKGNLITSPAGAQGKMQVMPGTNTDPGFGVRPAQNNSDEERTRVGRDYLAAMMKRYKNNPAEAWAAYNWGPGNLDNAKAKHGDKWLENAPKETRDYVTRNMAQLGGRGGAAAPEQQAPKEHDVRELLARVDGMNLPFDVEQKVRARLMQRVALDESLLARQQQDAQEEAWGVRNSLGENFKSIEQIPSTIRQRMTQEQLAPFIAEAERNANQPRETNWQKYAQYSDMAATDPAAFAKLNPAELRRNLGDGDFEQVMGWRRSVQGALSGGGKSVDQVTLARVKGVTDPLVLAAGITRPPDPAGRGTRDPEADKQYWARVGQFRRKMSDDVARWQKNNPGKEIDDNAIRDIADRNLLVMYRKGAGDKRTGEIFEFERQGAQGYYYQRPNVETERIRSAYRKRWGRDPTESEINQIYRFGPLGGAK